MASEIIDISLTELENMLPFERDIYLEMFAIEMEKIQNERAKHGKH